jgi:hypothetical protein
MPSHTYHFVTHWRVESTPEEVYGIIDNAPELKRWWPSVYLDVVELEPGDAQGVGKLISLFTKGWLPYTLRWQFRIVEKVPGERIVLEAWGDFVGRGIWMFAKDGEWVDVTYDWEIRAEKPLLRRLSLLLKPVFAANHRWAMVKGEESLKLELARRRAPTPEARDRVPAPPGPTTSSSVPLLLCLGAGLLALAVLVYGVIRLAAP